MSENIDFVQHCGKPEDHMAHAWFYITFEQQESDTLWCKGWRR